MPERVLVPLTEVEASPYDLPLDHDQSADRDLSLLSGLVGQLKSEVHELGMSLFTS